MHSCSGSGFACTLHIRTSHPPMCTVRPLVSHRPRSTDRLHPASPLLKPLLPAPQASTDPPPPRPNRPGAERPLSRPPQPSPPPSPSIDGPSPQPATRSHRIACRRRLSRPRCQGPAVKAPSLHASGGGSDGGSDCGGPTEHSLHTTDDVLDLIRARVRVGAGRV